MDRQGLNVTVTKYTLIDRDWATHWAFYNRPTASRNKRDRKECRGRSRIAYHGLFSEHFLAFENRLASLIGAVSLFEEESNRAT